MLFNLLNILKNKITKGLYSTLTYCVHANDAAQEVVRATSEDYNILYARLNERFQKNSDVEKEKLQMEFEKLKPRSKETSRVYYGRIDTLATDLWTVFHVNVTNDMVRRALFKHLQDTTKTNFLQLKATEPYSTGPLHDLCISK